jgi:hypothetical protein
MTGQAVAFGVMVYRLWAQVQDGQARTTPGKALGYLFIPFYNFYWAFVALPGLAEELNRCLRNRGLSVKPASPKLMIAYCVLCIVGAVPLIGLLTVPVTLGVAVAAFGGATRVSEALEGEG